MGNRILAGFSFEEHTAFAAALEELMVLAERYPVPSAKADQLQGALKRDIIELKSEMDEHVFKDCGELPKQQRFETYYPHTRPEKCGFERPRKILTEKLEALERRAPHGKAAMLTRKILRTVDTLAALETCRTTAGSR
ncbi:hypothetical protein [Desulfovibrio piger]|uniref:hypothetical protein n=1 Tax=Desulfovibrio piger TaxID=901 RepID=UPI00195A5C0E|nr:hypothetical protein [Desulfovibrio piger]MBM6834851.1 hypothetical protein [Desulfovibrio piger]